jgi:hypothetical protein
MAGTQKICTYNAKKLKNEPFSRTYKYMYVWKSFLEYYHYNIRVDGVTFLDGRNLILIFFLQIFIACVGNSVNQPFPRKFSSTRKEKVLLSDLVIIFFDLITFLIGINKNVWKIQIDRFFFR